MQPEIKTGVIVLQGSDNESGPHAYITRDATNLILAVSEALWANQPPTRLPPNPKEYIGNYTIKVGVPQAHMTASCTLINEMTVLGRYCHEVATTSFLPRAIYILRRD